MQKPGTLLLHVGPHKTATSYLQHHFDANRARLLEAGWLYPQTSERVRIAHHDVSDHRVNMVTDDAPILEELRRIGDRARNLGVNIFMSSEGFRHWKPKHLEPLRAALHTPHIHIA